MEALRGALRLDQAGGHCLDREIGLGITLLEDAGAVISLSVTVHVLTMDLFGDGEVIIPCFWCCEADFVQNILAVIDHLEVAIDHEQHGLATDFLAEFAEIGCDVVRI